MSLSSLPMEILEFIVEAVSPTDIVSFSQCSRRIRLLCRTRLAEYCELGHTMPRELNIMPLVEVNYLTGNEDWSEWGYVLRAVRENRRAGWYVENLKVVERLRQDWGSFPAGTIALSQSRLEHIWPLLRDSTYLTANERIEWYRDMLLGQEGPLLALLLSITPRLRWVSFSWGWGDPYVVKMLNRIAAASQRCAQVALSEIPSVGVDQDSQPADPTSLSFLKTWAALPTIVEVYLHGVILTGILNGTATEAEYLSSFEVAAADSHPADTATAEITSSNSGVTHLFFSRSDIECVYLSPFLRYFSNLRSFESTLTNFGTDGGGGWCPRLINETLQKYSKHTLEELRITRDTLPHYPTTFDSFIGSLASFRTLKTLVLQFDMFLERTPTSVHNFSTVLPLSIERLMLLDIANAVDPSSEINRLLDGFNCTQWPSLRLISFQCQGPRIPVNDLLKPLLRILVASGNTCSLFSGQSASRRRYKEPDAGVDVGFRVEALSSPRHTGQTAPNVFSYIHVETDSEEVSREHTSQVSDYLRLDNVFDFLALG